MLSKQYRNLLFDFGNVLIDLDIPLAYKRMRELLTKETGLEVFSEALVKYEMGKISTDIFINTLLSQCSPKVQALDIIEAWNSMLIGIPDYRLEMLTMLRPKYNLYLLSNTNELHMEWIHQYLQKKHGVPDFEKRYWDGVYYSHQVKDRKPHPSIYQYVIKNAPLDPSVTLFFDDMSDNLNAAREMGFGTHLVKEKEEIAEFLKVEGFY
ncbi:MAG TPA: HAD family phosphatase [Saprospiraceae bacterium]|nr:HAD family phosphatase [Saprospiraceae bacterium]